jgi:hypothetical protein
VAAAAHLPSTLFRCSAWPVGPSATISPIAPANSGDAGQVKCEAANAPMAVAAAVDESPKAAQLAHGPVRAIDASVGGVPVVLLVLGPGAYHESPPASSHYLVRHAT